MAARGRCNERRCAHVLQPCGCKARRPLLPLCLRLCLRLRLPRSVAAAHLKRRCVQRLAPRSYARLAGARRAALPPFVQLRSRARGMKHRCARCAPRPGHDAVLTRSP
jgi:hypothetical protein